VARTPVRSARTYLYICMNLAYGYRSKAAAQQSSCCWLELEAGKEWALGAWLWLWGWFEQAAPWPRPSLVDSLSFVLAVRGRTVASPLWAVLFTAAG